ncbi:MAG: hypothetical protein WA774_03050, partial [Candidatus Acidiferrales bacterium]
HYLGWRDRQKSLLFPVAGKVFLLTLPFIERPYRTNGFRTRPAIPNFTDHADICACDAKSKDYEISCKNGATDLIVIICGATCCKQEG